MTSQKKAQVIRIPVALVAAIAFGVIGWFLQNIYAETKEKITNNHNEIVVVETQLSEHIHTNDTLQVRAVIRDSIILSRLRENKAVLKEIKELLNETKSN